MKNTFLGNSGFPHVQRYILTFGQFSTRCWPHEVQRGGSIEQNSTQATRRGMRVYGEYDCESTNVPDLVLDGNGIASDLAQH